ncbi:SseB family protein [Plantactinospora sp. WMMC1484]|uniref:SseB family protein n=1 Tax=Plantactinospora sp. WMMC1484 TaxID=3404122 RepID=UPI003BF57985
MTEWEPATETEAAMRDALRGGDQELYFRILARADLLLPVSAEALAGRAPMGWGTWSTGGRTHVLAFTSTAALRVCLAENAGSTRRASYPDLAAGWPNPEWWLAVNPGLPIEGYLPAWFVSQLSRGDVRLPGRSMGARARLEQVEQAARARATAAVPRRQPVDPPLPEPEVTASFRPEPEPTALFRPEPEGTAPFRPEPEPTALFRSERGANGPFRPEPEPAGPFRPVEAESSGLPLRSPGASRESTPFRSTDAESTPFRSTEPGPTPFRAAEDLDDPFRIVRHVEDVEPAVSPSGADPDPFPPPGEPRPAPSGGNPATVPVIAPTPAGSGLGGDFGSQISDDTSAGWMTPAGPPRTATANAANGSSPVAAGTAATSTPSDGDPGGPPPAWYGSAGRQPDEATPPAGIRLPEERPAGPGSPEPPPPEMPAPEAWAPGAAPAAPSLFTPAPRRSAGGSWSEPGESSSDPGESRPDGGESSSGSAGRTFSGSAVAQAISGRSMAAESFEMGSMPTERLAARVTEPFTAGLSVTERFSAGASAPEPFAAGLSVTEQSDTRPAAVPAERAPAGPDNHRPEGRGQPEGGGQPESSGRDVPGPVATTPEGGAGPVAGQRLPADFVPANEVERSLLDAAGDGSTDTFLSTLLLATVLLPVAYNSARGARPGDDGFEWRTELLDGERYVVVFTSPERLGDHLPETVDTVEVKFARLIRRWPDDTWSFAVNPGTPVGAKLPGGQIVALANWAAEVGLGDDSGEPVPQAPAEEEAPRSTYAPAREDPGQPTMMQKSVAPSQLPYYLDRGYDRVSGFVHRASEVAHLRTPAKLYAALGLNHPGSPFERDAEEIYVLRWPAYRPSLYRIPYGGQTEAAMRAMEGWVIERPPFRGNGFAPGESSDVVAEFKVDSVRLPHGAQLHRIGADGMERLVATLDCDVPVWRRAGED